MFSFGPRLRWHPARRRPLGARGERAAAKALRRAGYRILARNLRTPRGEVDLLARDGPVLVIVEVKTRAAPRGRATPADGRARTRPARVRRAQRRRLVRAARWLARQPALRTARGAPCVFRIDLADVTFDAGRFSVRIRRDVLPHR